MMTLPTPTQRQMEVLYLPAVGHTVVIGTAGCGKTTMALYRALHLGDTELPNGGKTAVITYNRSLTNWMDQVVSDRVNRPTVLTFHGWARMVLEGSGVGASAYLKDPIEMDTLTRRAYVVTGRQLRDNRVFRRHAGFFNEEIAWIDGMGFKSFDEYRDSNRTGRGETRLDESSREGVWAVRDKYQELREGRGYSHDLRDIASRVLVVEDAATHSPFRHLVIDEGQDFTPEMLRAMAHATTEDGSLAFFGDPTQQIYGSQMSWRSAGLIIRKQWRFNTNYRNTAEIAALAEAIGEDTSDGDVGELPARSSGEKPRLRQFRTPEAEFDATALEASSAASSGQSVAVLSRTRTPAKLIAKACKAPTTQLSRNTRQFERGRVYWGTVHAAKGFEFDSVFVVGVSAASWPDPDLIDRTDHGAATDQDRKLLYVATTRARHHLTISYAGTISPILPGNQRLYAQ